ncbi:MAG TPA: GNAT family N-acetyltransferase, partial [Gaiellaceae bacterium]|nr:GNAT family N-acetyltransferase [Gaiellaceae bacterium]
MSELELRPAAGFSDEELAALFTASYEGYLVPFAVDAATLRFLTDTFDLDREASRVALRGGAPVGIANLGLRGPDAWVGGVGVIPSERRRGTGRALMEALHEQARHRGVERVWLEVIGENTQALALYQDLGYG